MQESLEWRNLDVDRQVSLLLSDPDCQQFMSIYETLSNLNGVYWHKMI